MRDRPTLGVEVSEEKPTKVIETPITSDGLPRVRLGWAPPIRFQIRSVATGTAAIPGLLLIFLGSHRKRRLRYDSRYPLMKNDRGLVGT